MLPVVFRGGGLSTGGVTGRLTYRVVLKMGADHRRRKPTCYLWAARSCSAVISSPTGLSDISESESRRCRACRSEPWTPRRPWNSARPSYRRSMLRWHTSTHSGLGSRLNGVVPWLSQQYQRVRKPTGNKLVVIGETLAELRSGYWQRGCVRRSRRANGARAPSYPGPRRVAEDGHARRFLLRAAGDRRKLGERGRRYRS